MVHVPQDQVATAHVHQLALDRLATVAHVDLVVHKSIAHHAVARLVSNTLRLKTLKSVLQEHLSPHSQKELFASFHSVV